MPNSLSLLVAAVVVVQSILIGVLGVQWWRSRRDRQRFIQRRADMDQRAGVLVHELNQPLTAILSNAQAAQRFLATEPLDVQELREIFDDIVTDDKRAAAIARSVRGLLAEEGLAEVSGAAKESAR